MQIYPRKREPISVTFKAKNLILKDPWMWWEVQRPISFFGECGPTYIDSRCDMQILHNSECNAFLERVEIATPFKYQLIISVNQILAPSWLCQQFGFRTFFLHGAAMFSCWLDVCKQLSLLAAKPLRPLHFLITRRFIDRWRGLGMASSIYA